MTTVTLLTLSRFEIYGRAVQAVMTAALSGGLFATAVVLLFRKKIVSFVAAHIGELAPRRRARLTVLVGAVLGLLVSISSIGAGALGVTTMMLLYPRLPTARIVGSDIAHGVPLTLLAGLGRWMLARSIGVCWASCSPARCPAS